MTHTLIYGAPGAGKTTSSSILHQDKGISLYEGDHLREIIAMGEESEGEARFYKWAQKKHGRGSALRLMKIL